MNGAQRRRELSVWEAIGISLALMAPSMAVNINPRGTAGAVGRAVPLAFALATVGVLLVGYMFVRHRKVNSAGGLCAGDDRRGEAVAFLRPPRGCRLGDRRPSAGADADRIHAVPQHVAVPNRRCPRLSRIIRAGAAGGRRVGTRAPRGAAAPGGCSSPMNGSARRCGPVLDRGPEQRTGIPREAAPRTAKSVGTPNGPCGFLSASSRRTPGLGWRTVAICCAESGDQSLSRRRCATHRGWSGGRNACVGANERTLRPLRNLAQVSNS